MQLLDEGRVAVNSYSEGEFHGIDLKPFCNKTGREPSEGIRSMYNAFSMTWNCAEKERISARKT